MPIHIIDHGKNNVVDAHQSVRDQGQLTIIFSGSGNTVRVGELTSFHAAQFSLGSGNTVEIGSRSRLSKLEVFAAKDATIFIGSDISCTFETRLFAHEAGTIHIGDRCIIASGTLISCSDMHSIVDVKTGKRLNAARDVWVGDRVWLGDQARIMKGVTIGDGSIIGAGATVTRDVPENCLAAGVPARVVRKGVTWRPDLI